MLNDRKILTVTELNLLCRRTLENISPNGLWVRGEIRSPKLHSSGHLYFSMTDGVSTIDAVMWKSSLDMLGFRPEEGMAVEAFGNPTLYEKSGRFQFNAKRLLPVGEGARAVAFRQLKEKLAKEGLFDQKFKKPLPEFPFAIGVITSPTGAAIRDIIHVLSRRAPYLKIIFRPAQVQGDGASKDLIRALEEMNLFGKVDLIIIGRGGGSEEDLWCFNDEALARAIFASKIPVISAVGHEIDFTIADFVADKRAPTPSASAEIAVNDLAEINGWLMGFYSSAFRGLKNQLEKSDMRLTMILKRPAWTRPLNRINDGMQAIDENISKLGIVIKRLFQKSAEGLNFQRIRLANLGVESVLKRGFAIVWKRGKIVKTSSSLLRGDEVSIQFKDGDRKALIS